MKKLSLVILAAGLGSRYGGLKQIEPVGPNGEILMEYSIFDAIKTGFNQIIFVIRRSFYDNFRQKIGERIEKFVPCDYVFQEIESFMEGCSVTKEREKPWGTAHAVLRAGDKIQDSFAVINADDFYGREAFQNIFHFLTSSMDPEIFALAGYPLKNTLSRHGPVSRAVCTVQSDYLTDIVERREIERHGNNIRHKDESGRCQPLPQEALVSVNLWGFTPHIFPLLEKEFQSFLKNNAGDIMSEFGLPTFINRIIAKGQVKVQVLPTRAKWFGMTYRKDAENVARSLQVFKNRGEYPPVLFKKRKNFSRELASIFSHFCNGGEIISIEPYGRGHIHNTYLAVVRRGNKTSGYIFQRINRYVFKEPEKMMNTMVKVLSHLSEKMNHTLPAGKRQLLNIVPAVVLTGDSLPYYLDAKGEYWRTFDYIPDSFTIDRTDELPLLSEAGKCIGRFHTMMADFDCTGMHPAIESFHNVEKRMGQLFSALKKDACNRAKGAKNEIDYILSRSDEASSLQVLLRQGKINEYAVHNDTKLNNILFSHKTGKACCLIDLDTIMPGLRLFDFGEIVRTGACSADEDEKNINRIHLELNKFERIAAGYLSMAGDLLSPLELALLPFGGIVMTFENGIRFLTDYLEGDCYFKTSYPGHNLNRCRAQLKLVQSMEDNMSKMKQIVRKAQRNTV
jgi:NDP-sugar pyrophosphorylase family protein